MDTENFRIEKDSIGTLEIEKDAYYGVQSLRGKNNFQITSKPMEELLIKNLAKIKKCAIIANSEAEVINPEIKNAVVMACNEIIEGKFLDEFIVDTIQGGAGTSANMNANEVICNRAIEILGGTKGDYSLIHPNDTINKSQSTNDVFPTAGKLTIIDLTVPLIDSLKKLKAVLKEKAVKFSNIVKMARTQLQDAVPMNFGRTFEAYSLAVSRDIERINEAKKQLYSINLGGTAIGSGIDSSKIYFNKVIPLLSMETGYPLKASESLFDGTSNLDCFLNYSASLKTCAMNISKMCNDLRLLGSGPRTGFGEVILPPKQNGSSIMPGKVNPVILEVCNQIAFMIAGNDLTISMAVEAGQLELNAFEPIIFNRIFESQKCMKNGIDTLIENCLKDIKVDEKRCKELVNNSVGIVTALVPHIGYQKSAEIAKEALRTGKSVKEIVLECNLVDENLIDEILNVKNMTEIY